MAEAKVTLLFGASANYALIWA